MRIPGIGSGCGSWVERMIKMTVKGSMVESLGDALVTQKP
jgi:hypothetical protein